MNLQDQQKQAIAVRMQKLEDAIKQCAPHPDNPGHRGFIYAKTDQRTAGDRDSMFGSIVADQILGCGLGVFSEGIVGDLDIGHFVDAYDEYWVDRRQSKESAQRAVINSFNAARLGGKHQALEAAFEADLPARVQIERKYMQLSRDLDQLEVPFDRQPELSPKQTLKYDQFELVA